MPHTRRRSHRKFELNTTSTTSPIYGSTTVQRQHLINNHSDQMNHLAKTTRIVSFNAWVSIINKEFHIIIGATYSKVDHA